MTTTAGPGYSFLLARTNKLCFTVYPPIHDRKLDPSDWYGNYIGTYLDRDVRNLLNVRDLGMFQRFLRFCAARTGQLVNSSALANDVGVNHNTITA